MKIILTMLSINDLFVTQHEIRNRVQLSRMVEFVKDGGFFTINCLSKHQSRGKVSPLIEVTSFEDGRLFLHDGHHRAAAIVLGGREFLDSTEYRIRYFTYDAYIHPNLSAEWYTPFDPRCEARLADMSEYKNMVHSLTDEEAIMKLISENKNMYSQPCERPVTLQEFVDKIKTQA